MARWTYPEIRRLLALLRQPEKLEAEPLAMLLREATEEKSAYDALNSIINRAIPGTAPIDELMRKVIWSHSADSHKSHRIAASLGLSIRSYFRYRATAIEAVALAVDRTLHASPSRTRYEIQLAEMVAQFDPQVAFDVLSATVGKPSGEVAYELLCSAIKAGRPITRELVNQCEGPWRTLAMAALGRRHLIGGEPRLARLWRNKMSRALAQPRTPIDHSAAFELAQFDRLEALRRCDMPAARTAAQQMAWHARSNSELAGLALVAEAEQACDDGDFATAGVVLGRLADLNATMRDFRVMARTAHAQALVAMMHGRWDQALDLARLSATALSSVEPGYSICAHVNAGRTSLLLGRSWQTPREMLDRFSRSWITGMILAVESRHLMDGDPEKARRVAQEAIAIATAQDAAGMLSYAQSSLAFALDALGAAADAQAMRVQAWELAIRLGRQSYLYDVFVHPKMRRRALGAFAADSAFLDAIGRRIADVVAQRFGSPPSPAALAAGSAVHRLIATLVNPGTEVSPPLPNGKPLRNRKDDGFVPTSSDIIKFAAPQLIKDLEACLPHHERERFSIQATAAIAREAARASGSDLIAS